MNSLRDTRTCKVLVEFAMSPDIAAMLMTQIAKESEIPMELDGVMVRSVPAELQKMTVTVDVG